MCSWLVTVLSLLALGAQCLSQDCNETINIMITSNGTMTLPEDNWLTLETNLSLPVSWRIGDQDDQCINRTSCPYPDLLDTGSIFNVSVTNGTDSFLLNIVVEAGRVVCRDLTLGILLPSNITMSCYPVSSCDDVSDQDLDLTWQIRYNSSGNWMTLQAGPYMPPDWTGLMSEEGENMVAYSDGDKTLNITSTTEAMVGYYQVLSGEMTLSSFAVFLIVMPEETYRLSVNVVEGRSEIFIPCHFRSFPQVNVSWQRILNNGSSVDLDDLNATKYSFVNITETDDDIMDSEQQFDLTLSLYGGLIIHDITIEDHGVYECVGSNGFVSTTESLIFRVRDHLRPLWPALGIIGVFITTAMFILASYLIQRLKEDKERTIGPSEIDGEQEGFQGRPSMISMDADEENALVSKRIHSDGLTK